MTSGQARLAFDLSKEPSHLRERYGLYSWGQSALLARRLVEAGVRLVHVNWAREPGDSAVDNPMWDTHAQNSDRLQDLCHLACEYMPYLIGFDIPVITALRHRFDDTLRHFDAEIGLDQDILQFIEGCRIEFSLGEDRRYRSGERSRGFRQTLLETRDPAGPLSFILDFHDLRRRGGCRLRLLRIGSEKPLEQAHAASLTSR